MRLAETLREKSQMTVVIRAPKHIIRFAAGTLANVYVILKRADTIAVTSCDGELSASAL